METLSIPSASTDGLVHVPCVLHHRDGGYLCLEPKTSNRESAAVAYDRDIIPHKKYILQQKGCTSPVSAPGTGRLIRTKADFYNALDQLISREVAIKDVETNKYLTSEQGMQRKPSAKFKEKAHFFHVGRTETGAYRFGTGDPKKPLYLHKSSKTKSWAMKGTRGPAKKIEIDIDTSHVNFSPADEAENANDWIIEPDDGVVILDSLPTREGQSCHGKILFLGVVNLNSGSAGNPHDLDVAFHFSNVPAAWRAKEQWDGAIRSIKRQLSRGVDYCIHTDYVGSKTKWVAKLEPGGKLCVVIASSNFRQEHMEGCVDRMGGLVVLGKRTGKDLSELGWQTQTEEVQSTENDNKKTLKKEKASGIATSSFQRLKDIPVSLLHRSGKWFSLQKNGSEPDLLYLEPIREDAKTSERIRTTGDYFGELNKYSNFTIKNGRGEYLFSRERTNVFGKEKKHHFRTKYLVAGFTQLESLEEAPETFVFGQNSASGGISIKSNSGGCYLSRNRKGEFVFMARAESTSLNDDDGEAAAYEEDTWFIDTPDLPSGVTSDGLIFACIVRRRDKKVLASRHAPGRPTAWRTTESWDLITDKLLENVIKESSTIVTDSDTGHKWFATNSDGNELFVVIATGGFPLYYGTKTVLTMEDLHQTLYKDGRRSLSSSELYRVMRDIDTEYRYELCFGNDEVLDLIQDVEELTDKMMANIDELKANIAKEQDIEEKAKQLHVLAQQFKKKSNKKKWNVAAAAVAGGAVVGGVFGWLVGCPASVIVLESQMAEIALSASVGMAPGVMKSIVLLSTDTFWKRKFVNFGNCIDSRRRERARGEKIGDLEQEREQVRCKFERSMSSSVIV